MWPEPPTHAHPGSHQTGDPEDTQAQPDPPIFIYPGATLQDWRKVALVESSYFKISKTDLPSKSAAFSPGFLDKLTLLWASAAKELRFFFP